VSRDREIGRGALLPTGEVGSVLKGMLINEESLAKAKGGIKVRV
jgi:hypothetical protein